MEENVALDSKKQRKFVKSIRGIKKLIKKNEGKAELQKKDEEKVEPKKPFSMRIKDGRVGKKKKRKERGLVYLSHIPHGFYEHQMTEYFKQFGVVTNVRVIRSKRTGSSKGFAFVEFREPAVGQIVAETMNNYLMGKRLIKAAYIPPEKQKRAFRKHWNTVNNPGSQSRLKMKKAFNADKDENGELKRARKLLSNLNKNKKKLSELGINYDFFAPVDVPEALLDQIVKQEKDEDTVKEEIIPKKDKKGKQEKTEDKKVVKSENTQTVIKQPNEPKGKGKKNNKNKQDDKPATEVNKKSKPVPTKEIVPKVNKKEKVPVNVNEKQQRIKEQQLKAAGVKPSEEFIKLIEDADDESDSSYDFDSDEYEKMMQEDNSDLPSGDESDDESGEDDDSDQDEESDAEEVPPKKVKGTPTPKLVQPVQTRKQLEKQKQQAKQQLEAKKQQPQGEKQHLQGQKQQPQGQKQQPQVQKQKPQVKKQEQKIPVEVKRKAPQKVAVSPKKPKFEKQSQKPLKKQFKKK